MRKVRLKTYAGFSLLELMVVVAIIGVLATVAVPRFNIFRARARQGEAKSNLGVIFTLQEAFKIDKEEYYNGNASTWGGQAGMDGAAGTIHSVGYHGSGAGIGGTSGSCSVSTHTTESACTGASETWTPGSGGADNFCGANKLGFRLANCAAARYRYFMVGATEGAFLAVAHGLSDQTVKRIFPGCEGTGPVVSKVSDSKSKTPCSLSAGDHTLSPARGDAFCLDAARTVDNFTDIVEASECTN